MRCEQHRGSPIELTSIGMREISVVDSFLVSGSARHALGRFWVCLIRPPVQYGPCPGARMGVIWVWAVQKWGVTPQELEKVGGVDSEHAQ